MVTSHLLPSIFVQNICINIFLRVLCQFDAAFILFIRYIYSSHEMIVVKFDYTIYYIYTVIISRLKRKRQCVNVIYLVFKVGWWNLVLQGYFSYKGMSWGACDAVMQKVSHDISKCSLFSCCTCIICRLEYMYNVRVIYMLNRFLHCIYTPYVEKSPDVIICFFCSIYLLNSFSLAGWV